MTVLPALDSRLALAVAVLMFAGVVKSITGLGIPVVGTPLLVVIYHDLPLVVVLMSLPTMLCTCYFVLRTLHNVREAAHALVPLIPFGVFGVVVGSYLLVSVDQRLLMALLAGVITTFLVIEWRRELSLRRRRAPAIPPGDTRGTVTALSRDLVLRRSLVGSVVGLSAGAMQGASGASGPLVTMYLFKQRLSRRGFFLAVNAVFLVFDSVQLATLAGLGQFGPPRLTVGVLACVPLFSGVAIGAALARRISDAGFRIAVLLVLTATVASLVTQVAR